MKFKVGDNVIVTAGASKGKTGEITKILKEKNKVLVKGVNIKIKHVKKSVNGPGQRIEMEAPIHASNVMIADPKTNKPTRIFYKKLENGKKERYAQKSKEPLS